MADVSTPLHAPLATPLATSRIHRALSRPNHLMGADRELVLVTGLATVILIFVVLTWFSALFGAAIWIVVMGALRVMAKENREARMSEAEKKAAALPPKLTVPMIIFFLPVLFAVIMGPAMIQIFTRTDL